MRSNPGRLLRQLPQQPLLHGLSGRLFLITTSRPDSKIIDGVARTYCSIIWTRKMMQLSSSCGPSYHLIPKRRKNLALGNFLHLVGSNPSDRVIHYSMPLGHRLGKMTLLFKYRVHYGLSGTVIDFCRSKRKLSFFILFLADGRN